MPGSPEILCSVVEKTGWGGGLQSQPHRPPGLLLVVGKPKAACFWLISSLIPLPDFCSRLPWKDGRKKGNSETIKATAFTFREGAGEDCFQVASQGPSPPGWGKGWAWRRGQWAGEGGAGSGGGGAALTAPECFFPGPSGLAAPFSQAFPHHLRRISIPPCPAGTSRTGPRT